MKAIMIQNCCIKCVFHYFLSHWYLSNL